MPSGDAKFTEICTRYGKQIQAYVLAASTDRRWPMRSPRPSSSPWRRLDQIEDVDAALPWLYGTGPTRSSVINGGARPGRGPWRGVSGMSWLSTQRATDAVVVRQEQTDLVLLATSPQGDRPGGPAPRAVGGGCRRSRSPSTSARSGETAGVSRGATWRGVREVGGDGWTPAVGRRRCMSVEEQVVALFVAANPVPDPDLLEPLARPPRSGIGRG